MKKVTKNPYVSPRVKVQFYAEWNVSTADFISLSTQHDPTDEANLFDNIGGDFDSWD